METQTGRETTLPAELLLGLRGEKAGARPDTAAPRSLREIGYASERSADSENQVWAILLAASFASILLAVLG